MSRVIPSWMIRLAISWEDRRAEYLNQRQRRLLVEHKMDSEYRHHTISVTSYILLLTLRP